MAIITIVTVFCIYLSVHIMIYDITALMIVPPSSYNDYRQMTSLLVDTFDDPTFDCATKSNSLQSKIDAFQWNMFEKAITKEYTCNKYISTARKMQGNKYCVFIAKDYTQDNDGNQQKSATDSVIGMVEMGMSLCPVLSGDDRGQVSGGNILRPHPTIGVLCVNISHRNKGVGQALIQECEQVVLNVWNEQYLFVDVEPKNENTLKLFRKWGYVDTVNDVGETQLRNTTVSRRRKERLVPHYLLQKCLQSCSVDVND